MRDKKVFGLMKKEFGRRLGAGGRSLALDQSQIRSYFSRRAAALKRTTVDDVLNSSNVDNNAAADAGSEPLPAEETSADYDKFKVYELKKMLKVRGLPVSGAKPVLIARLESADNGDTGAAS